MKSAAKFLLVLWMGISFLPGFSASRSGYYVLAGSGPCILLNSKGAVLFNGLGRKLEGKELLPGEVLKAYTGSNIVLLEYPQMNRLTIGQNSIFKVKGSHSVWMSLGKIWVKVSHFLKKPFNFEVQSPNAVAVAHGTEFEVRVGKRNSSVYVFKGVVLAGNKEKMVRLLPGHYVAGVEEGMLPPKPQVFNLKKIQNPWWKANLQFNRRFGLFLKYHTTAVVQLMRKWIPPANQFPIFHQLIKNTHFYKTWNKRSSGMPVRKNRNSYRRLRKLNHKGSRRIPLWHHRKLYQQGKHRKSDKKKLINRSFKRVRLSLNSNCQSFFLSVFIGCMHNKKGKQHGNDHNNKNGPLSLIFSAASTPAFFRTSASS
jgi:hypothetical protein